MWVHDPHTSVCRDSMANGGAGASVERMDKNNGKWDSAKDARVVR